MTPDEATDSRIAYALAKAIELIVTYAETIMDTVHATDPDLRAQMWREIARIAEAKGGGGYYRITER